MADSKRTLIFGSVPVTDGVAGGAPKAPASKDLNPAPTPSKGAGPGATALVTANQAAAPIYFVKFTPEEQPDPRMPLLADRDSAQASAFRMLKNRLMDRGPAQALLVTSAIRGEGKSVCATNLALALAENGQNRVLLVDASFGRPALASLFGFKPPKCFAEQMDKHRDKPGDPWVIVQLGQQPTFILAVSPPFCDSCATVSEPGALFCGGCGKKLPVIRRQLDGRAFSSAIRRFREAFDHIVIDGPPILESADVSLIQDVVDGVVMVSRKDSSRARVLKKALEQIAPVPVMGVAMLDF